MYSFRYKEYGYDVKFNLEAQKLGVRGVTVVVASGDDGAAGYEARIYITFSVAKYLH
jgi:subtilase family serine protease